MKKSLAITSIVVAWALFVGARAATAADLEVIRGGTSYIAIIPYNWTGFYVGGNLGAEWSRTQFTTAAVPSAAIPASAIARIDELGTGMPLGNKLTGGLQVGFNWQVTPRGLIGIEADVNSLVQDLNHNQSDRVPAIFPLPIQPTPFIGIANSVRTRWLATVRGRLGATFNNNVLLYLTAGAAFTTVDYTQTFNISATNVAIYGVTQSDGASSVKSTKVGWTAGAGTEWALSRTWTAKVEYLYAQFGGSDTATTVCSPGLGCVQNLFGSSDPLRVQIARLGVNYRFWGAPISANY